MRISDWSSDVCSSDLDAIRRAGETVRAVHRGRGGTLAEPPVGPNARLYSDATPLAQVDFETKVKLLQDIDAYARSRDPRVRQALASSETRRLGKAGVCKFKLRWSPYLENQKSH